MRFLDGHIAWRLQYPPVSIEDESSVGIRPINGVSRFQVVVVDPIVAWTLSRVVPPFAEVIDLYLMVRLAVVVCISRLLAFVVSVKILGPSCDLYKS